MGLVSVFGNNIETYYEKLLQGESGIRLIDRFDASKLPSRFAGQIRGFSSEGYIDGKNDRRTDDCLRYCLVSGKKALESAGLGVGSEALSKISLPVSVIPLPSGDSSSLSDDLYSGTSSFVVDSQKPSEDHRTLLPVMTQQSAVISADLKPLHGSSKAFLCCFSPESAIDKLRAGVLVGTGMGGLSVFSDGVQALIEKGHRKITPFFIPYAITNMGSALLAMDIGFMGPNYSISTASAIIPIGVGGFIACRALSQRNDNPKTASRPWDKGRDGFVMGEGAGVLVNYINAHATSTIVGDLAEVNAIKQVFKDPSAIQMNARKARTLSSS
ncbi:hypothetical protein ZIOFF_049396 [Zingiber officinale]|uniref:beta-ketoacyl-[acyl-carrier-protein] synthase I n=1 Tax=Zingiber officinale TaxID=94328 RepID=A0A8J5KNG0_ZINOF|nr:hypothetical protein ZIOFF_049396 [Zingiber officinale]